MVHCKKEVADCLNVLSWQPSEKQETDENELVGISFEVEVAAFSLVARCIWLHTERLCDCLVHSHESMFVCLFETENAGSF
jgi:alpha/beta superfamily hydrolase